MSRVHGLYPTRFLRQYVKRKTATDPLYDEVVERLRGSRDPILDLGCGIGVLAAVLRERGIDAPVLGIDHDAKKIDVARNAVRFEGVDFETRDVRDFPEWRGTVVMLDLLHYFDAETQSRMLARAAQSAATIIVRDALRDGSWRYRVTVAQERFSRAIGWLRGERLEFPTRESIARHFDGFVAHVTPAWGRTPFNNYLFVFKRSSAGTTNV